jgi:arylsulfatase A-like enzyme
VRGHTRDQLVLNIDIAPTLIAAAGLPVPRVMQGQDLGPLYLRDEPPSWRDEFFYEHPTITSRDRIPSSQGVIRRDWKYVYWPEFDYEQLFNLNEDGDEIRNLAGEPTSAGQRAQARAKLEAWRARAR